MGHTVFEAVSPGEMLRPGGRRVVDAPPLPPEVVAAALAFAPVVLPSEAYMLEGLTTK
jgi:hypothetical protein